MIVDRLYHLDSFNEKKEMTMAFERFENIGGIYVTKASISNRGIISLSQGACNSFCLKPENAKFVQLYYDKENCLIGLKFVAEQVGAVANVRFRNTSLDFSAKSLLDYYEIMPKKTSSYEVSKSDEGMIVINMRSAKVRQTKDVNSSQEDS